MYFNQKESLVIEKVLEEVDETVIDEPKQPPMLAPLKGPPMIDAKLFGIISGHKWDQMAGFIAYARDSKLGPMAIENWRKELIEFNNKGVK